MTCSVEYITVADHVLFSLPSAAWPSFVTLRGASEAIPSNFGDTWSC